MIKLSARPLLTVAYICAGTAFSLHAQNVAWRTNCYTVTGATMHEIRQSMGRARPFPENFDGLTTWNVNWQFSSSETAEGCRCTSFSTKISITTFLPRWSPSAEASPRTKEQWTKFVNALADHELGHARIALAAAEEVRKQAVLITSAPSCQVLKEKLNSSAERVLDAHRQREKEYDRRTNHGVQ